jgi:UDP-N-acetylmuramyl tripeptide synthase
MRSGHQATTAKITTKDDTLLQAFHDSTAVIDYGSHSIEVDLKLKGIYNILNATAAVALARRIMGPELSEPKLLAALSEVTPAFGRGEDIIIDGQTVELVLVKNPSGFRLSLRSFDPLGVATMIAINDNYADGRDMSWLWDVNFDSLRHDGVAVVSGIRAYDMALRLQYDEVDVVDVCPNLTEAIEKFIDTNRDKSKRIYCTYTAMLALRKQLAKHATMEKVL